MKRPRCRETRPFQVLSFAYAVISLHCRSKSSQKACRCAGVVPGPASAQNPLTGSEMSLPMCNIFPGQCFSHKLRISFSFGKTRFWTSLSTDTDPFQTWYRPPLEYSIVSGHFIRISLCLPVAIRLSPSLKITN